MTIKYLLHLAKDKKLKRLIDQHEALSVKKRKDLRPMPKSAMFSPGREDIFAIDDWGVQNAMIGIYKLDRTDKKAFREALLRISAKWSPYRNYRVCICGAGKATHPSRRERRRQRKSSIFINRQKIGFRRFSLDPFYRNCVFDLERLSLTLKLNIVRKFKIFFLAVIVIGVGAMTSCSKSNSGPAKFTDSVFYSAWAPLNMTFQQVDQNTGDSAWEQVITNSKVTASIISSGVVLTYVVQDIPSAGDTVISSADNLLQPFLSLHTIDLGWEGGNINGVLFRYVIIPGNVLTTSNITPKQLKSMNYTEVTQLLGGTTARQSAPGTLSTQ